MALMVEVPSIQHAQDHDGGHYHAWGVINDPIGVTNELVALHHDAQPTDPDMTSK